MAYLCPLSPLIFEYRLGHSCPLVLSPYATLSDLPLPHPNRAHSHTTPSRMIRYVGCSRLTGAMPCSRASRHVIRPFPFVSHRLRASLCWCRGARCRLGHLRLPFGHDHLDRGATRQDSCQSAGLPHVHAQPVLPLHRHDPPREPAAVHPRHLLASVFLAHRVAVDAGARQRQVRQVTREPALRSRVRGAQSAVVGFRCRDHVPDVSLASSGMVATRAWPVHPTSQSAMMRVSTDWE